MFKVRAAGLRDVDALAQLRWDFRSEDDGETPCTSFAEFAIHYARFFNAGFASSERAYFVAELNGKLIGNIACHVVALVPRPCRLDDACGVITDNYVRPEHRDGGIGSALLSAAVDWARMRDLELVIVWPSDRARPFYARNGFSERTEIMEMVLRPYVERTS